MLKKVLAILLCVTTLLTLCACGPKDDVNEPSTDEVNQVADSDSDNATVDLKKIFDDCVALMPEMYPLDSDKMYNSYGVNPEDYVECYAAISADGMLADEIWIIKAKDADALKRIQDAAKNRIQAKDEESITYSPEQNKIVKASETITIGEYFAFICSPDVDKIVKVCNDAANSF